MKVALAFCGLAILAQSSRVSATASLAAVQGLQSVVPEPELTWEELNPPGSSKYSLPQEYWGDNTGGEQVGEDKSIPYWMFAHQDAPPTTTDEGVVLGPNQVRMEDGTIVDLEMPETSEPQIIEEGLSGVPPEWVLRQREGLSGVPPDWVLQGLDAPPDEHVELETPEPQIIEEGLRGVPPEWVLRQHEGLSGVPPDWVLQGLDGPPTIEPPGSTEFSLPEYWRDGPVQQPEPMPEPPIGLSGVPPPYVFRARFEPRDDTLPWLAAMDDDRDSEVSSVEYVSYVQMLREHATSTIERGNDAKGVALLKAVAEFHYDNMQDCILHFSKTTALDDLPSVCNIKFRYSLFAGPAPFEWIASSQPTVSSEKVGAWYEEHFQAALRDVQSNRIRLPDPSAIADAELHIKCIKHVLSSHGSTSISRGQYYTLVEAARACAESDN